MVFVDNLTCVEAALTGEAKGIKKNFHESLILAGTNVVDGEGIMLVVAVGTRTAWGKLKSRLKKKCFHFPMCYSFIDSFRRIRLLTKLVFYYFQQTQKLQCVCYVCCLLCVCVCVCTCVCFF